MTSEQARSVIGNLADLHDGQIALPRFFVKRDNGLFVDLTRLESAEAFNKAVNQVFSSGAYFLDLDYELFTKLLFGSDCLDVGKSQKSDEDTSSIRIATDVVAFPAAKRVLYKDVKIGDGVAEYFFEPICPGTVAEGVENKIPSECALLTFDEFVADMWLKGIHFGIDADAVRTAITNGVSGFIIIARRRDAVIGNDATLQEVTAEIHRDDAPKMLPDGRVDLHQFKNRFPQINKDTRLIKKIPLVSGTIGYEISGDLIEPPIPKDLDLASLSGPGTVVEINQEGEFIVSKQVGFLNFDAQTHQISITEKIINRGGVSAKTTGDLILTGEEYEEFGEVQEKCLVEANNIVMHADVFGNIVSRGGKILLKSGLKGGTAINREGDITIEGVASGAVVQTKNGEISMQRAENCVLIGTRITVENASNCDILADEVKITEAEGCAIVAKKITIANAGPRKQSEMLVFIPVSDLVELESKIGGIRAMIEEIEQSENKKRQTLESATSQPDVKKYLMVAGMLKRGEITLTAEQQGNLKQLAAAVNPTLRMAAKVNEEIKQSVVEKLELVDQVELLIKQKKAAESGVYCSVANINGEILVQALKVTPEKERSLYDTPPSSLKATLRCSSISGERVFAGHSGLLDWKFTANP